MYEIIDIFKITIGSCKFMQFAFFLRINLCACTVMTDLFHVFANVFQSKSVMIEHAIVGWNDEVKHYHGIAHSEFKFWKQNNMPRSGPIFREMSIARARFKHALKQCRLDKKK